MLNQVQQPWDDKLAACQQVPRPRAGLACQAQHSTHVSMLLTYTLHMQEAADDETGCISEDPEAEYWMGCFGGVRLAIGYNVLPPLQPYACLRFADHCCRLHLLSSLAFACWSTGSAADDSGARLVCRMAR